MSFIPKLLEVYFFKHKNKMVYYIKNAVFYFKYWKQRGQNYNEMSPLLTKMLIALFIIYVYISDILMNILL